MCICQKYVIIRFATKVTGGQYSPTENEYVTEPIFLLLRYIFRCQASKRERVRAILIWIWDKGIYSYVFVSRSLFFIFMSLRVNSWEPSFVRLVSGWGLSVDTTKTEKSKEYREY